MSDGDKASKKASDLSRLAAGVLPYQSAYERLQQELVRQTAPLDAIKRLHDSFHLSALSRAMDNSGLSALQRALDLNGSGVLGKMARDISGFGAATEAIKSMNLGAAAQIAHDWGRIDNSMFGAVRAMDLSGLYGAINAINSSSVGRIVEQLNRSYGLGLDSSIGREMQLAANRLTGQIQALTDATMISVPTFESFGLTNLQALLERSVAAQGVLLEDEASPLDPQGEGDRRRRMEMLTFIITVLTFLIMVADHVQEWVTDDDVAVRENTAEIVQMREALDSMANEFEAIREDQDAEAARESKADAEIAGILRSIADALAARDKEQPSGDDH